MHEPHADLTTCEDHSITDYTVLSLVLRNGMTVVEYALGIHQDFFDDGVSESTLWNSISLTCLWPTRHQQSSSMMLYQHKTIRQSQVSQSGYTDIESQPDDQASWLHRITDGEQGRPNRISKQTSPSLR